MAGHRLYILSCGKIDDPQADGSIARIPVPAYLVRTATGRTYLVDTGNPTALIGAPDCQPWYPPTCVITADDDLISRIRELGLEARDIDAIIATHFDFDHAGRYDAFGPLGTDVYVQRAHMAEALSNSDRYDSGLWRIPGLRWRLIDGDFEIEPGLMLLRTDGHAVGHQSLAVETEAGWVILAADAIDNQKFVDERTFSAPVDAVFMNQSIDRLLELARLLNAPIVFGHDAEQWTRTRLSPEPFGLA